MADTRSTYQLVRDHGKRLHTEGTRRALEELARAVPDSDVARASYPAGEYPQRLPKLRTSQQVTTTHTDTRFAVTIRYTAPQANYTEHGTSPHVIQPKGEGYPLRFFWPKVNAVVYPWKVNHPGSHKRDGWFSGVTRRWGDFLRAARGA